MESTVSWIAVLMVTMTIISVIRNAFRVYKKFEIFDFVKFDDLKHLEPKPANVQEMMKNI